VSFIDSAAVNRLKKFHQKLQSGRTTIIVSEINRQIEEELFKLDLYSQIGKNNILDDINQLAVKGRVTECMETLCVFCQHLDATTFQV